MKHLRIISSFLFLISVSLVATLANSSFYRNAFPNEHTKEKNIFPGSIVYSSPSVLSAQTISSSNPQFVLLSFDGSRNLQMWEDSRKFAREASAERTPVAFTYFISGVYFLPYKKASLYRPPSLSAGSSLIGFADSAEEIPNRITEVQQAIIEGHEIGSHLNGHFQGGGLWDKSGWSSEIKQFKTLLANAGTNSNHPEISFPGLNNITGIRTPNLSKNKSLYPALEENGYRYDSSQVGQPDDQPYKIGSIWEIPLKDIPLEGTNQSVISMDYNFYSRQSDAKDVVKKGTPLYDKFYNQTFKSYQNYFYSQYNSNRSPVVIGHHFSLWNDGVYWQAMQDFIKEVCGLPDVYCTTFSQYVNYLNSK